MGYEKRRWQTPWVILALLMVTMVAEAQPTPTPSEKRSPTPVKREQGGTSADAGTMQKLGSGCDETTISDIRHDGAIVETDDGHLFEVDEVDQIDSSLWLPADDLLVCWQTFLYKGSRVTLYTLRDGSDKVDAHRIR